MRLNNAPDRQPPTIRHQPVRSAFTLIKLPAARRGFTLIELLTVIGIIAILVGILLPVLSAVRQKGYETTTRAELGRIATGINAYYNDFKAYPGPIPEANIDSGTSGITGATTVTSTENLVLGLLGGLKNAAGTITYDPNLVTVGPQSLNSLNPKTYNSYMDVTTEELSPKDSTGAYITYSATAPKDSAIPEFQDHIPGTIIGSTNSNYQYGPILYLRCRVGASGGNGVVAGTAQTTPKSPYFFAQLAPYNFLAANFNPVPPATTSDFPAVSPNDSTYAYFVNPVLANQPRSKDSFILISAGTDRRFGTKDDIIYGN